MPRTAYGFREAGQTHFVIVAPHAAGDDLRTGQVAKHLASALNASLVVNDTFIKPRNSAAASHPELVEDFNQLSWTRRGYDWRRKKPAMKTFYDHVKEFAAKARGRGGRAVVIYIHGMQDNPNGIGIDIGPGAKNRRGAIRGAKGRNRHPDAGNNTGVVRAGRADIENLKDKLSEGLGPHGLTVGVGRFQPAWSRRNGVQIHAGTSDHSLQLEISSFLRGQDKVQKTAAMIAQALKETYPAPRQGVFRNAVHAVGRLFRRSG